MQHHWDGGDGVWLAIDASGHIAVLTTAGVAPIPNVVLANYERSPEDRVNAMPVVGGYDRIPHPGDLSSWTGFAARGFFGYDWQDVHRTSGFSRSYELMAIPAVPIVASQLDKDLFDLARLVIFETIAFDQTYCLEVQRLLPCDAG
jgi:hypothetical protein